jgi:superfamily II DNA or RNA helicase
VDEGHLNFHANFVIDTRLNVKETVVLTATFDVTDQTAKSIFDRHYPPSMRFGEGTYKKYVNVTAALHRSARSKFPPRAWKTPKGYSHVRLEKWIMHPSRKALLAEFLDRTMRLIGFYYTRIRANDQRCLVFCSTVEMCKKVVSHIRKHAPEYVTNVYVAESPEEVLTESDIIVSTLKSAGTGKDIPKLRTVIQTVAVGSTPQNIQNLGRPRELRGYPEEHSTPEFVYTADEAIPKQMDYHRHRSFIFGARAKAFRTISI